MKCVDSMERCWSRMEWREAFSAEEMAALQKNKQAAANFELMDALCSEGWRFRRIRDIGAEVPYCDCAPDAPLLGVFAFCATGMRSFSQQGNPEMRDILVAVAIQQDGKMHVWPSVSQ